MTLALSHNADLLILDEPTSGLDPVSRDDLLDVFLELCEDGKTILFSTHITSDLDKCAENIIYIKSGKIIAETSVKEFENKYKIVGFENMENMQPYSNLILGQKRTKEGYTALMHTKDAINSLNSDLESIMVHIEKEAE